MSTCQHVWSDYRVDVVEDVPITVRECLVCGHLWLVDIDAEPPSVPWPQ